jgi:hypothetical protein
MSFAARAGRWPGWVGRFAAWWRGVGAKAPGAERDPAKAAPTGNSGVQGAGTLASRWPEATDRLSWRIEPVDRASRE